MIIKTSKPKAIWKAKTILGEGTLWVPSHNSIYFVDIKNKDILSLNIKTKKKNIIKFWCINYFMLINIFIEIF